MNEQEVAVKLTEVEARCMERVRSPWAFGNDRVIDSSAVRPRLI